MVGLVGTIAHFGILTVFVEAFRQDPLLGSTVGFMVALTASYYLNRLWTFQSHRAHTYVLPRYTIVSLVGLGLNTSIMFLTVRILDWWYLLGQLTVIGIVPISNFLLNLYWSFGEIGTSQGARSRRSH